MNLKLQDNNDVVCEIVKNANLKKQHIPHNIENNEFVRAQHNNLFTASMPPKYQAKISDKKSKDS